MTPQDLKPGYSIRTINNMFTTMPMWFFMWRPITIGRYDTLKKKMIEKSGESSSEFGMLECPKMFGRGFIGMIDEKGDTKVEGEFIMKEHIGPYEQLADTWRQLMKDYPKICNVYQIYVTDPNVTKPEHNITQILFQVR